MIRDGVSDKAGRRISQLLQSSVTKFENIWYRPRRSCLLCVCGANRQQHTKVLGSPPVRKGRLHIFKKDALKFNNHFYTFRVYEIKF